MKNIEDILVEAGLITSEKLQEIKSREDSDSGSIGKILLSEGMVKYKESLAAIAGKMGVEFVDLENIKVNRDAVSMLSYSIARKYTVFPFEIRNNLLQLAMKHPDELFLIDEIKVFTQMEIKPYLADERMIDKAINYFYRDSAVYENDEEGQEHAGLEDNMQDESGLDGNRTAGDGNNAGMPDIFLHSTDDLIQGIISRHLKPENVTDIHVDTANRTVLITLSVKY